MKHAFLLLAAVGLLAPRAGPAQVPALLNYQGRVTAGGTNFDGTAPFKFALVNTTGSTNYWSNDGTPAGAPAAGVSLTVTKGLYSVLLGDTTLAGMSLAIPPTIFTNADVRLRVWFNDGTSGFQQLAPDARIAAVGYALVAANVDPAADVRGQRLQIGSGHTLSGLNSTIAGGYGNSATSNYATVAGGLVNLAGGAGATVGGGVTNAATGLEATVAGGEFNAATGAVSAIGGGYGNLAGGSGSTIAGGYGNFAVSNYATVAGGLGNYAGGAGAGIGGGITNTVAALEATIAGGELNWATGAVSTIGGGYRNLAGGIEATVAGGESNAATGIISSVGGGYGNIAGGYAATVPGGYANLAGGAYSFAAGAGAVASNFGSFVWADASSTGAVYSSANNQFTARCAGGVRFFGNSNATVGVQLIPGANAWSIASDRNLKENFKPVDARAVLARLVATPVTEWNLISQDPAIRHIGPMAQDFQAAFGVGEDDRHISTSDADGVAFAAIQGLNEIVKEKDARIAELEKRLDGLQAELQLLGRRLAPTPAPGSK